jgi:hypothetical protein
MEDAIAAVLLDHHLNLRTRRVARYAIAAIAILATTFS